MSRLTLAPKFPGVVMVMGGMFSKSSPYLDSASSCRARSWVEGVAADALAVAREIGGQDAVGGFHKASEHYVGDFPFVNGEIEGLANLYVVQRGSVTFRPI